MAAYEPKPPRIPAVGELLGRLNNFEPSDDPHAGRNLAAGMGEVQCGDEHCPECGDPADINP